MNTLSVSLQKIVDDYKNDLQKFIAENNLDAELARDIEERIFEKIATLENPTRKDILKILAEIGTPEEIFAEEINLQNDEKPKNFFEKFHERTNKIIFLGTFFELAKKTSISANIFRILFFAMIIFGFTVWDGFLFIFPIFAYFMGFLLFRTRFFGFLFSLGLGAFFTILLVPSVILFGMYLSDFHIENIYPFMGISVLFPIGMVLGIFSLVLFILYFFRYAFTKNWFGIGFLVTAIVSFVVAISMGIAIVFDLAMKYSHSEDIHSIATIEPRLDKTLNIFPQTWVPYDFPWNPANDYVMYWTHVEPSETDKIEIQYTTTYRWTRENIETMKNSIKNISFDFDNRENIVYSVEKNQDEKIPFVFVVSDIEVVKVPPFQKFIWTSPLARDAILFFDGWEKYDFLQLQKISDSCSTKFYDENRTLNCDITKLNFSEIMARPEHYYLNDLKNLKKRCEIFYQSKNMEANCGSIDEKMEEIKNQCNNGKQYLCSESHSGRYY